MPIPVVCPSCSAKLKAPDRAAGGKMSCPKCDEPVRVPYPDGAAFSAGGPARPRLSDDSADDGADLDVSRPSFMPLIFGGSIAAVGLIMVTLLVAWLWFGPTRNPAPPRPGAAGPPPAPAGAGGPRQVPQAAEPAYADATKGAIPFGEFEVLVLEVRYDKVPITDLLGEETLSEQPMLMVQVGIRNKSPARKLEYAGWAPGGGVAPGGLAGGGGAIPANPNPATLKDDLGNVYRPAQFGLTNSVKSQKFRESIYPGKNLADVLVFEPPVPKATSLLLELPLKALGGSDSARFRIPTHRINRPMFEQSR
ncbi:MAG: hypothetical protein U0797_29020 [Gemmataceae bacterium]